MITYIAYVEGYLYWSMGSRLRVPSAQDALCSETHACECTWLGLVHALSNPTRTLILGVPTLVLPQNEH